MKLETCADTGARSPDLFFRERSQESASEFRNFCKNKRRFLRQCRNKRNFAKKRSTKIETLSRQRKTIASRKNGNEEGAQKSKIAGDLTGVGRITREITKSRQTSGFVSEGCQFSSKIYDFSGREWGQREEVLVGVGGAMGVICM